MKARRYGFSLVELLTVIGIIMLLVGILMPALGRAIKSARQAKTKAYMHSLTIGLEQYRNDFGRYPDSSRRINGKETSLKCQYHRNCTGDEYLDYNYTDIGAHRLAEAMFGLDKLGVSTDTPVSGFPFYYVDPDTGKPVSNNNQFIKRMGPYIATENLPIGLIKDGKVTDPTDQNYQTRILNNPNPVIEDGINKLPILYYKANTRGNFIHEIFDYRDNDYMTHPFGVYFNYNQSEPLPYPKAYTTPPYNPSVYSLDSSKNKLKNFLYFIWDSRTGTGTDLWKWQSGSSRPYNKDSFILWSAGIDGEYGTEDDITNFERAE